MILADTTYAGHLNVSDMFTRMMLGLVATGIAPGSFYQLDAEGNRQRAHFNGLPVESVAEAIATLGAHVVDGFETYHVMNPHDDGIGADEYVDWLIEAGYPIQRSVTLGSGCSGLRPACVPCRIDSASTRRCGCCCCRSPIIYSPQSQSAGPSRRPTDSVLLCKKRKSAPTTTSRTSRRRSSSNTSPTCNCSDCSSPLGELQPAQPQVRRPASVCRACGLPEPSCFVVGRHFACWHAAVTGIQRGAPGGERRRRRGRAQRRRVRGLIGHRRAERVI